MDNLQEGLISKSNNGIRYFNLKGVDLIKTCLVNVKWENQSFSKFNVKEELENLHQNLSKFQTYKSKNLNQLKFEKMILTAKIFELHEIKKNEKELSNIDLSTPSSW